MRWFPIFWNMVQGWFDRFPIFWNMIQGRLGGWIFCAAGILIAVILHRKDIKCRFWPVIPAILLWLACEFAELNVQSARITMLAIPAACVSVGYAAGWLATDIVYLVKNRKKEQK